jgi:hypothetical protein
MVGGLVCLAAWAALRGIPAAVSAVESREAITAQRSELLVRSRQRLARFGALDDSIAALEGMADALPRLLLVGADPATASVDLMRRLRGPLSSMPLTFVEFGAHRAPEFAGPLSMASVSLTIEGDYRGILGLIEHVERDSALAVESLEVVALEPDGEAVVIERLRATLVVSGWHRPEASARPVPPGQSR